MIYNYLYGYQLMNTVHNVIENLIFYTFALGLAFSTLNAYVLHGRFSRSIRGFFIYSESFDLNTQCLYPPENLSVKSVFVPVEMPILKLG